VIVKGAELMDAFFAAFEKHFWLAVLGGWLVTCAIVRIIRAARGEGEGDDD
jgi:hypothetical protein